MLQRLCGVASEGWQEPRVRHEGGEAASVEERRRQGVVCGGEGGEGGRQIPGGVCGAAGRASRCRLLLGGEADSFRAYAA